MNLLIIVLAFLQFFFISRTEKTYDYWCYTIVDIDVANKKYEAKSYSFGHLDKVRNNELFDSFFRDKANKTPQGKPIGKTEGSVANPIKLSVSEYLGDYKIHSSQFQVKAEQGNYFNPLVNIERDFENIYSDSGKPDFIPIDKNKGIDLTKLTLGNNKLETGKHTGGVFVTEIEIYNGQSGQMKCL